MTTTLKHRVKDRLQAPALIEVKMDRTGRAANRYVNIMDEIREKQETLDIAGSELIDALKEQNRKEITVRGVTLKIKEIEAKIKISVKRPKDE